MMLRALRTDDSDVRIVLDATKRKLGAGGESRKRKTISKKGLKFRKHGIVHRSA